MSTASRPDSIRATAACDCARLNSRSGRARSMFGPERDRKNDRYGWIDDLAPELLRASRELVESNEACRVSDEAVAQILTAAIRLYVAKSDGEERTFPPIAGRRDSELTPTELLSAVSAMPRAPHPRPTEVCLWDPPRPRNETHSSAGTSSKSQAKTGPQDQASPE